MKLAFLRVQSGHIGPVEVWVGAFLSSMVSRDETVSFALYHVPELHPCGLPRLQCLSL